MMEKDRRQGKQFDPRQGHQQGGRPPQQQPASAEEPKRSFFGRVQEALQTKPHQEGPQVAQEPPPPPPTPVRRDPPAAAPAPPPRAAEDPARPKMTPTSLKRMIVPEGVLISGSMTSAAETEISGRIEGDVIVEGRLYLGTTAVITGNVKAVSCRIEGHVEGKMECSDDIEIGQSGKLNADAKAGKQITIAGHLSGSAYSSGVVRLVASGKVLGNISTRRLFIEEGAVFNGKCIMTGAVQKDAR